MLKGERWEKSISLARLIVLALGTTYTGPHSATAYVKCTVTLPPSCRQTTSRGGGGAETAAETHLQLRAVLGAALADLLATAGV